MAGRDQPKYSLSLTGSASLPDWGSASPQPITIAVKCDNFENQSGSIVDPGINAVVFPAD